MKGPELTLLLQLLTEAPSTVKECAALLGLSDLRTQVGMWQLTSSGRARAIGAVPHSDPERRGRRKTLKLYAAVALGD